MLSIIIVWRALGLIVTVRLVSFSVRSKDFAFSVWFNTTTANEWLHDRLYFWVSVRAALVVAAVLLTPSVWPHLHRMTLRWAARLG